MDINDIAGRDTTSTFRVFELFYKIEIHDQSLRVHLEYLLTRTKSDGQEECAFPNSPFADDDYSNGTKGR